MTDILMNVFLIVASLMALSVMVYVIVDMVGVRRTTSAEPSEKRKTKPWPTVFLVATLATALAALLNCAKKLVREWRGEKHHRD